MLIAEARQVIVDSEWWQEFGDQFGWKLHAFTRRETAQYFLRTTKEIVFVSRTQRDEIQEKLDNGGR